MANKYYYLVASLPYLRFGEEPPVTTVAYLGECEKWLNEEDLSLVRSLDIKEPDTKEGDTPLIRQWKEFDLTLKTEIAGTRKKGEQVSKKNVSFAVREALDKKDPLARERAVEKMRWAFLDGEEHKYTFDTNSLVLYGLKVQILERLAGFDAEQGRNVFDKVCEVKYE